MYLDNLQNDNGKKIKITTQPKYEPVTYYKPGRVTGIFGNMGCGKTMLMTILGISAYAQQNKTLYSNYALKKVDYQPINTLNDAYQMRDGIFLADEFWTWIWSRKSMSDINTEFMKLIMLCRKRGVAIIYTAQLSRTVDVLIREVTNHWLYPWIQPYYNEETGELIATRLCCRSIPQGRSKHTLSMSFRSPLKYYGQFYDTTEEIDDINNNKNAIPTPIEKGIQLEEKFADALVKSNLFKYMDWLPHSGVHTTWEYDLIAYSKNHTIAFDVKSTCGDRVTLEKYGKDLRAQIKNAYEHHAKPFIVFPEKDRKQLTNPKFWFVHEIHYHDYLTTLSSKPTYGKLVKNSIPLLELKNYLAKDKTNGQKEQ